jgi:hypothetical protein
MDQIHPRTAELLDEIDNFQYPQIQEAGKAQNNVEGTSTSNQDHPVSCGVYVLCAGADKAAEPSSYPVVDGTNPAVKKQRWKDKVNEEIDPYYRNYRLQEWLQNSTHTPLQYRHGLPNLAGTSAWLQRGMCPWNFIPTAQCPLCYKIPQKFPESLLPRNNISRKNHYPDNHWLEGIMAGMKSAPNEKEAPNFETTG